MRDQAHSMTETELQGTICAMAEARGWLVKESSQGSQNKPRRPARRKSNNGYPDLTLARDGEVLWLELKRQDGDLDADQIEWSIALPSNSQLVSEAMDRRGHVHYEVIRPSDLARGRVDELLA